MKQMVELLDKRHLFLAVVIWGIVWLIAFGASQIFGVDFRTVGFSVFVLSGTAVLIRSKDRSGIVVKALLLVISFIAIYVFCKMFGYWGVSDDSYVYQVYSETMVNKFGSFKEFSLSLSMWGVFFPVLLAGGQAIYLNTPTFLNAILGLLIVQCLWEVFRVFRERKSSFIFIFVTAIFVLAYFFQSHLVHFSLGYVHNNLLFGFIWVLCFFVLKENKGDVSNFYFCLALNALVLLRIEGAVYGLSLVVTYYIFHPTSSFGWSRVTKFYLQMLPALLWYLSLSFFNFAKPFALVSWRLHFFIVFLILFFPYVKNLLSLTKSLYLWGGGLLVVFGGAVVFKPGVVERNIGTLVENILSPIIWGTFFWPIFAGLGIASIVFFSKRKTYSEYLVLTINALSIVILLGMFHFYRVGWGDSGNRMMLHLVPLYLIWLGQVVMDSFYKGDASCE